MRCNFTSLFLFPLWTSLPSDQSNPPKEITPPHPSIVALCPQKPILAYPCDLTKGNVCIAKLNEPGAKSAGAGKDVSAEGDSQAYGSYQILTAHDHPVTCLAFRKDGQWLATASSHGTIIRVWETETRKLVMELKRSRVGREATIKSICFSDDGTMLVVSSSTKTIHIFSISEDKKNDKAFAFIRLDKEGITESEHISSFKSDNKHVQVAFADGNYRVYRLPPPNSSNQNCECVNQCKLLENRK